jgi:hypothetical protein
VPLPEVLRAYRIAIAMLWQRLIDAARAAGVEAQAALLGAASTLWEIADEYSQALTEAYRQTVKQQLIADERRRSALVASLQNGTTRGQPTAWEIAKLLGMPFEGAFLVVVAGAPARPRPCPTWKSGCVGSRPCPRGGPNPNTTSEWCPTARAGRWRRSSPRSPKPPTAGSG